ncbi:MAG: glutamate racemase [Oscillospiraceae bacterium]|nr:glutamate racemase [Oscillospiraceae bacterium]
MDNRAIGVFDSGLGGLTAVRALHRVAPNERVVYFGDTGRVPYGGRAPETILTYTQQALDFLQAFDTKAVIVACGTASAVALPQFDSVQSQDCIGVVTAACNRAARATMNGKIGVIGTAATVHSDAYLNALHAIDQSYTVMSVACPLFVPLVENGRVHRGDIVAETVTREYLAPLRDSGVDTLILGCTHYPLLADLIAAEMGKQVTLIDAGHEAALATLDVLRGQNALAGRSGEDRYFVSDSAPGFAALASLFLGADIMAETVQL